MEAKVKNFRKKDMIFHFETTRFKRSFTNNNKKMREYLKEDMKKYCKMEKVSRAKLRNKK